MALSLLNFVNQTDQPRLSGLVQKITNVSVFMPMLHFIPCDGFSYKYGQQTSLGGIAFRALNEPYTPDVGVVSPKEETLAILGGQVNTDYQLTNKQNNAPRASAIMAKTKRAGLFFDKMVIDGDPAIDPRQFWGLNIRLGGNQVIAAGTNGAALTLDMIDRLIDAVVGPNDKKRLIMCKADRRAMKALVLANAHGATTLEVGQSLPSYDDVPIVVIDEDGDDQPILAKDETMGSSNVTSSIYCVAPGSDTDGELMQGLIGSRMIETYPGGQNGPIVIDVVEMNGGIALFHPRAAARLQGLL